MRRVRTTAAMMAALTCATTAADAQRVDPARLVELTSSFPRR